jgi:hypothetical protein
MQPVSGSRGVLASSVWVPSGEDETRAYLQSRLAVFAKLVFWTVVGELALLNLMYAIYAGVKPDNANAISTAGGCGLAVLAVVWRVVLVRCRCPSRRCLPARHDHCRGDRPVLGAAARSSRRLQAAAYTRSCSRTG